MRKMLAGLCAFTAAAVIAVMPTQAAAAINEFVGSWENVDRDTGGLTRLVISRQGPNVTVHLFGACTPRDCDIGRHRAIVYSPTASGQTMRDASALTVQYRTNFSRNILVVRAGRGQLSYEHFTNFTDGSGRSDYTSSGRMRRERGGGGGGAGGGAALNEDCLPFNPNQIQVARRQGNWKIIQGNRYMFDFGNNQGEARRSFQIIRNYGFNQVCYVGRPNPSMVYLKRGNAVPSGNMSGDDCIRHNADSYTVRADGNGRWLLTDGRSRIKVFPNRQEANQALRIIRRYRLGQLCYVGRPQPSFEYWLSR